MLRQDKYSVSSDSDQQITQITSTSKNAYVQAKNKGYSTAVALAAADKAAEEGD